MLTIVALAEAIPDWALMPLAVGTFGVFFWAFLEG